MTPQARALPRCVKASDKHRLYPPEVFSFVREAPGEPRLWPASAVRGYTQRLRVIDAGLPPFEARVIRIDTTLSGTSTGHLTRLTWENSSEWVLRDRTSFQVSAAAMKRLNLLVAKADLAQAEFWGKEEDDCFDGYHVLLERATPGSGYGSASGNLRCQDNPAVEAVLKAMAALVTAPEQ